jgi:hypothetical protein
MCGIIKADIGIRVGFINYFWNGFEELI